MFTASMNRNNPSVKLVLQGMTAGLSVMLTEITHKENTVWYPSDLGPGSQANGATEMAWCPPMSEQRGNTVSHGEWTNPEFWLQQETMVRAVSCQGVELRFAEKVHLKCSYQIQKQSYEPKLQRGAKNLIVHFKNMEAILKLQKQTREKCRSTLAWEQKTHS